jgi:DNA topoisomerase-1
MSGSPLRRCLPKLRKKVEEDLRASALSRDTVLAAVVRLIDSTHMRVGNEEYAKANKSFGATTLRNRHAKVERGKLKISYTGKHGIKRTVTITDRNLARIAKKTQDLPGQHLFEYVDEEGEVCPVTSATSTPTSRKRWAATSPPRISAPGARASSPSSRC